MITNRMGKLQARRTDPMIKAAMALDEAYDRIRDDDTIRYAVGTMQPIEHAYTTNTFAEGNRVQAQLDSGLDELGEGTEFRYQGSVTNDTHVKAGSDLDLLVIETDFETVEPPGKPRYPYSGDPLAELKTLRANCAAVIRKQFPKVRVDDAPGRCISLSGGSLRRKIDLVIANWWNTVEYQGNPNETFRGVRILDTSANVRRDNKPFLHNERIDTRDAEAGGNLRKTVRFLKSLKYDADTQLAISSYDIASICWNMPLELLGAEPGQELLLIENVVWYLKYLLDHDDYRNGLEVPNGMRKVFGDGGASKTQLQALYSEAQEVNAEIQSALAKSYRSIQDARVRY